MPPAYIVFIKESTQDQKQLDRYGELVGQSFKDHGVKFLAAYGTHEVLEGPPLEGVVILEFLDIEVARAWYFGPAYQEAAAHRFSGATYRAVMVEGRATP